MNIDEFKNIEMITKYFNSIIQKNFIPMKNVKLNLKAGLGLLVFLMAFSLNASAQSTNQSDTKVKQEVTNNNTTSVTNATPNNNIKVVRNTTNVSMKISSNTTDFEKKAIEAKRKLIATEKNGKRIQSSN